jgi:hypothetical protein
MGCFIIRGTEQLHEFFLVLEDDLLGVIGNVSYYCGYFGGNFDDITEIGDFGLDFK